MRTLWPSLFYGLQCYPSSLDNRAMGSHLQIEKEMNLHITSVDINAVANNERHIAVTLSNNTVHLIHCAEYPIVTMLAEALHKRDALNKDFLGYVEKELGASIAELSKGLPYADRKSLLFRMAHGAPTIPSFIHLLQNGQDLRQKAEVSDFLKGCLARRPDMTSLTFSEQAVLDALLQGEPFPV